MLYHPARGANDPIRFPPKVAKPENGFQRPLYVRYNGISHYDAYVPTSERVDLQRALKDADERDEVATFILKHLVEGKAGEARESWEAWKPAEPWRADSPFLHVIDLCKEAFKLWPLHGHAEYVLAIAYQHSNKDVCAMVAAKNAWVLGVQEKLEPRVLRTLAKAYFELELWEDAFETYEDCQRRGWLEDSETPFLERCRAEIAREGKGRDSEQGEEEAMAMDGGAWDDGIGSDGEAEFMKAETTGGNWRVELISIDSDDEIGEGFDDIYEVQYEKLVSRAV